MKKIKSTTVIRKTVINHYSTKHEDIIIVESIVNDNVFLYDIKCLDGNDRFKCPILVDPEFFNSIKDKNPFQECKILRNDPIYYYRKTLNDLSLKEIYNMIENDLLIFSYNHGHIIFNSKKEVIPYVKKFSYINSLFSDGQSNLTYLLEYLKQHDWVTNKEDLKIDYIPHYNAYDDNYKHIKVNILVPHAEYNKIYNNVKHKDNFSTSMHDYIKAYKLENNDPMGLLPFIKK